MLNFIKRVFGTEQGSGQVAKNRLKVVIMQDRTTFTPMVMQNLKHDLVEVFKKYLEIDEEGLEFNLDREDENVGLAINIPIMKVKSDKELENSGETDA